MWRHFLIFISFFENKYSKKMVFETIVKMIIIIDYKLQENILLSMEVFFLINSHQ
jgi:hypothetical protein